MRSAGEYLRVSGVSEQTSRSPRYHQRPVQTAALVGAGVTRDAGVLLADELRLGLRGQVRRVLAPPGVDVRQRLQLKYEWAYLLLAVDPRAGTLRWHWLERPRAAPIKEALAAWAVDAATITRLRQQ